MYAENQYYELSKFAKTFDYGNILSELKDEFGYIHSKEEIDDIGLKLQVTVKRSKPMYLHRLRFIKRFTPLFDSQ